MAQTIENAWLYLDAQASTDAATEVALEICQAHGASLSLITVVESPHDPFLRTDLGQEMMRLVREDKRERLQKLEERVRREMPQNRVASVFLEGEIAWHTLTSHSITMRPDLVIVPADGDASDGRFGTFSQHLFRKCPVPVWSVQPTANRLTKRVLVAVDSGPEGSDQRLLSQEVLNLATGLAAHTGMELHLGHAWRLYDENLITARYGAAATLPYLNLQQKFARDFTEQLLQQTEHRERITVVHYPKGEAGKAIPTLAQEISADVVILGSAARRGIEGFFMGSVAETILSRLVCSALVVKRPGFISPIANAPMPYSVG